MLALLDTIFLQPLMQIYAVLFGLIPAGLGPGLRLIVFSLIVNLVLLPAYLQMERSSRRQREIRHRMSLEVARMRRHFRGRERYFYVRAVHRQFHYHPFTALLGSADLLVQILVFATVYRFLSALPALKGVPFGPVADLGAPDGLMGGMHLLPFVMTAINVASVFAYSSDRGRRLQGLGLALLFLVLLYPSPSGLVVYWITNNFFSLFRNLAGPLVLKQLPARWTTPIAALMRQQ